MFSGRVFKDVGKRFEHKAITARYVEVRVCARKQRIDRNNVFLAKKAEPAYARRLAKKCKRCVERERERERESERERKRKTASDNFGATGIKLKLNLYGHSCANSFLRFMRNYNFKKRFFAY